MNNIDKIINCASSLNVDEDVSYQRDFIHKFNIDKLESYSKKNNEEFLNYIFSNPDNKESMFASLRTRCCGGIGRGYAQDLGVYKCINSKDHKDKIGHWCDDRENIIDNDNDLTKAINTANDLISNLKEIDHYIKSNENIDYYYLSSLFEEKDCNYAIIRKYIALNNPDKMPFFYTSDYIKKVARFLNLSFNDSDSSTIIIGKIIDIYKQTNLDMFNFCKSIFSLVDDNNNNISKLSCDKSKNIILYGPPGTSKTYNTILYSLSIIKNRSIEDLAKENYSDLLKDYNDLKNKGLIEFITFHQSYSYEEFIEGIKPKLDDSSDEISYELKSGIFKNFCEQDSYSNDNSAINFDSAWGKLILDAEMNNDVLHFVRDTGSEFDAELDVDRFIIRRPKSMSTFTLGAIKRQWMGKFTIDKNSSEGDKWRFAANKAVLNYLKLNCSLKDYDATSNDVKNIDLNKKVFIIDEINRGNISKIFGELITLIEPSKRLGEKEEMKIVLPYSQKPFGIPNNIYIIGTMNTSDKSISHIDTALRRRFDFIEMMPDSNILKNNNITTINGIDIIELFNTMNKRIEFLFDREHTIGHTFFLSLKDNSTIEELSYIFRHKIIPLLQEYFYDDYEKIQYVLGDNQKSDDKYKFIKKVRNYSSKLFGSNADLDDCDLFVINNENDDEVFKNPDSYIKIYANNEEE